MIELIEILQDLAEVIDRHTSPLDEDKETLKVVRERLGKLWQENHPRIKRSNGKEKDSV